MPPSGQFEEDAALEFLASRIDYERSTVPYGKSDFRLDRMRDLLARLGNPQNRYPIVHVAGTKGKGSTSAMLASVLTAAGYRTGLYSSPHLDRVEERLGIDGSICTADELTTLVEHIRPVVAAMDALSEIDGGGSNRPTYFEIVTALAMLHFARQGCDAAVLEVGMGGRLDSTNVCRPKVAVITSISFDHTQHLGNTLSAIAREKAGIIKPGVPIVSGVTADEPRDTIAEVAAANDSPLVELGRDFNFDYRPAVHLEQEGSQGEIDYGVKGAITLRGVRLSLVGRHQGANAAVAIATIEQLRAQGFDVPEEALRRGLGRVYWPARVEVIRRRPTVVLDAAHNVASAEALVQVLDESFSAQRRILVFATTRDKNVRGMLEVLLPRFDEVILTRYFSNPRSVSPEDLDQLAGEIAGTPRHVCPDPGLAWAKVRQLAQPADLICIAGSFFLAAEMRAAMQGEDLDAAWGTFVG